MFKNSVTSVTPVTPKKIKIPKNGGYSTSRGDRGDTSDGKNKLFSSGTDVIPAGQIGHSIKKRYYDLANVVKSREILSKEKTMRQFGREIGVRPHPESADFNGQQSNSTTSGAFGRQMPALEDKTQSLEVYRNEIRRLRKENAELYRLKEHFRRMALNAVAKGCVAYTFRNRFAKSLPGLIEVPHAYKAVETLLADLDEAQRKADDFVNRLGYRLPSVWWLRLDDGE